jgi:hypothetical protein
MAISDPQAITQGATTFTFARHGFGTDSGTMATANGLDRLSISHQYKARSRHIVRMDRDKIAANPFDTGLNDKYSMSVYTVFDVPRVGFTSAEVERLWDLQVKFLAQDTNGVILRVVQGES